MIVELAELGQLPRIQEIYAVAREYMKESGNPKQWVNGYPTKEMLLDDIKNQQLYVIKDGTEIVGAFVFIIGEDATYARIEDGQWLNSNQYGTIHRIASDNKTHGIFTAALDFCFGKISNIRIDTHADNKKMQGAILKNGFKYCGIIYVDDGSPRFAYQKQI